MDFGGKLPARFAFAIEPPELLSDYHGYGDELIITFMEWRRVDEDS